MDRNSKDKVVQVEAHLSMEVKWGWGRGAVIMIRDCAINIKGRCERIDSGRFFSVTFRRNSLSFFIIA